MGTASIGGSLVLGSGAYSQVNARRDVSIETVGDDDAYLRLQYNDDIDFECETVETILWVTNQLKAPIDELGFDVVGTDPEIAVEVVDTTDSIAVGETGEIVAELTCVGGEGDRTVNFEIEVRGEDLGVDAHRTDEIALSCHCPGETAWALLEDATGSTDPARHRLNEIPEIRTNRWGWYLPYELAAGPVTAQLWAGAGRNELDRGSETGSVTLDDDGDVLSVSVSSLDSSVIDRSHCYVGPDTDGLRERNAAPGLFEYDSDSLAYDQQTETYEIPTSDITDGLAVGDSLVVALHAEVFEYGAD